ncbi:cytochrome c [Moritella sp. 24]|uniref:c-type cytochrome n=1 Tax=Moritella sp. 24 TaxID=2746230 RepID=UPI001BA57C14|nr:cytochrome c [Moritella sp. 24]QUM75571.1 cytochrome c [Moritella sp. 24]
MKKFALYSIALITLSLSVFFAFKLYTDNQYGEPNLTNGQAKFNLNCQSCHGDKGEGDGIIANSLLVSPDNIYTELTNPLGLKLELINSVLEGDNGQDGIMPAFKGSLSASDVNDIFAYIKTINET